VLTTIIAVEFIIERPVPQFGLARGTILEWHLPVQVTESEPVSKFPEYTEYNSQLEHTGFLAVDLKASWNEL